MRLMLLTAALLAAEADFGTTAAPADPESVQASATEQPPVDNDHVAPGCEQFEAPASEAPASSASSSSSESANVETGGHAPDPAMSAGEPAADVGAGEQTGAVSIHDLRQASMAMPVIVRQDGKLAPGIVVEEDAGEGITVQVFRGDHLPHVAHHLARTEPTDTSDGWFFPWERTRP